MRDEVRANHQPEVEHVSRFKGTHILEKQLLAAFLQITALLIPIPSHLTEKVPQPLADSPSNPRIEACCAGEHFQGFKSNEMEIMLNLFVDIRVMRHDD